ncbi:(S)-ureidoglycine aminohydrolase [Brevibacterium sanguinis]|uniref:(S)-ureidoglycine aminohydrolase n=3 Tax=Brevibacterium TaxID=1696 RepID=A0A366II18_9MICO|nr:MULTISPECIES: bifunctional allantoicase/(S)-ureidoglycine aminohydrolase [Brevibacterium]RBP63471.1 (S)-ureidoglycine aminohydrolase [Brevibacterium sanguinis]RBP69938.1 (S)-ureidoglycine aminohydrolase [Brevibacterium celere]
MTLTTDPYTYWAPTGGHPPQSDLLTDRAIVTEAYTVIPRGVLRDIVTSVLPEWTDTRSWVLSKPVAGGAVTFSQTILEVAPGGGAEKPEPQPEVEGFIFLMAGEVDITHEGQTHHLTPGGFAFLPAGSEWSLKSTGDEAARFHWVRKRYQPVEGLVPEAAFGNEADVEPSPMPGTDGRWRTTRPLDPANVAYDMHVNIVTFEAGAVIPFAETHEMEHGLYVLEGKAVYRLNGDWVEVQEGDFISMRAFCPQACYAGGPGRFRYLLYKDVNRQVEL